MSRAMEPYQKIEIPFNVDAGLIEGTKGEDGLCHGEELLLESSRSSMGSDNCAFAVMRT